jgi:hypothetical protein
MISQIQQIVMAPISKFSNESYNHNL